MLPSRYSAIISALVFVLTGCSRTVQSPEPVTEPTPIAPPSVETPARNRVASWSLVPAKQATRYVSTIIATIESTSEAQTTRDTIAQQTRFTLLTATNSGSTAYLGSITEISTLPGSRIGSSDRRPTLPVSFTGHISNGMMTLDELNGRLDGGRVDCTDPAYSALGSIQHRVVVVPPEMTRSTAWTDSLKLTACNGIIPTTITSIRTSRVIGEGEIDAVAAILIEQTERAYSTGEGSEGQHRIFLKGETTGLTKLYIDAHTGALLSSEGEQQTNLTITAGQSRRFTQVVREKTKVEK